MSINEKTLEQKYNEHVRLKKASGKTPLRLKQFKAMLESNTIVANKNYIQKIKSRS